MFATENNVFLFHALKDRWQSVYFNGPTRKWCADGSFCRLGKGFLNGAKAVCFPNPAFAYLFGGKERQFPAYTLMA